MWCDITSSHTIEGGSITPYSQSARCEGHETDGDLDNDARVYVNVSTFCPKQIYPRLILAQRLLTKLA